MKKLLSLILVLLLAASVGGCGLFGSDNAKLELDQTALNMTVGDSVKLSAGDAVKVNWTSENDKIASVLGGTVTAKSAGSTVITASLESGVSATCNVTVTDKLIASVTLNPSSTRVEEGKTIQLTAAVSPADATDRTLTWASGDEDIAVVNSEGYVTAVSEGVTTITCTSSNGVEGSCTVTVSSVIEPPTSAPATLPPTEKSTEADTDDERPTEKPSPAPVYSDDFIFPDSSSRYLTESEIRSTLSAMSGESVSGSCAQDAVNEIFARNGYVFTTPSIRAYYASKSWYHADPSFGPEDLSDIEEYNITLLGKY